MNRELRVVFVFLALALLGMVAAAYIIFQSLDQRAVDADDRTRAITALMCYVARLHANDPDAHTKQRIRQVRVEPGGFITVPRECVTFAGELKADDLTLVGNQVHLKEP